MMKEIAGGQWSTAIHARYSIFFDGRLSASQGGLAG